MTVTYQNTVEDLVALYQHHLKTDASAQRWRWRHWLECEAAVTFLIAFSVNSIWRQKYLGAAFILAYGIWVFISGRRSRRKFAGEIVHAQLRRHPQPGALCQHTTTITDTEITVHTGDSSQSHPWPALHRIAFTPDHIFLYDTPTSAHILPKRDLGEVTFATATTTIRGHTRNTEH